MPTMSDENAQLRAQIAEAHRLRKIAEHEIQIAKRQAQVAEHQAQVAEQKVRNQTYPGYLESCHALFRKPRRIAAMFKGTRGEVANFTNGLYPRKIVIWKDFGERQNDTWDALRRIPGLWEEALFPSKAAFEMAETEVKTMGSEQDVNLMQWHTVESRVQRVWNLLMHNARARQHSGLRGEGRLSFETQESFRSEQPQTSARGPSIYPRNLRADQLCGLRQGDDNFRPLFVIEYKVPHKLPIRQIRLALQSDIHPDRDVIDRDGEGEVFHSRRLLAAVVTQLYSYMVDSSLRYGYVCTGEAYIFLRIPEDPWTVQCGINIPEEDYGNSENPLGQTAVAQVFAFIQQALSEELPGQGWVDNVKAGPRWKQEYEDVLANIPETDRESKQASEYQQQGSCRDLRDSPFLLRRRIGQVYDPRIPIFDEAIEGENDGAASPTPGPKTRSRTAARRRHGKGYKGREPEEDSESECDEPASPPPGPKARREDSDSEGDGADGSPKSPTPGRKTRSRTAASKQNPSKQNPSKQTGSNQTGRQQGTSSEQQGTLPGQSHIRIQNRPYCSHDCLLGLCSGLAIDPSCPNATDHGQAHISRHSFLRLVRQQLAIDRGPNADCCSLFIRGARGVLLKIRLKVGGYTLVAKGMDDAHKSYLAHEATVYDRLRSLQGRYVPVCCGSVELQLPYHYIGVELRHILLLSWAGMSLAHLTDEETLASIKPSRDEQLRKAYEAISALQVRHNDVAPRNQVYDRKTGRLMVIDFERSDIVQRPALCEISSNRKRKRPVHLQQERKRHRGERQGDDAAEWVT